MQWDSHSHLHLFAPSAELAPAMVRLGLAAVCSACRPEEWPVLAELTRQAPRHVFPAFGIHPWYAAEDYSEQSIALLRKQVLAFPGAWIGETGLDKKYAVGPQLSALQAQVMLAMELQRPLLLHCVGYAGKLFDFLAECGWNRESPPLVLHRSRLSQEMAKRFLDHFDCYFSLHPDSFVNGKPDLGSFPAQRILLESDAEPGKTSHQDPVDALTAYGHEHLSFTRKSGFQEIAFANLAQLLGRSLNGDPLASAAESQ